MTPPTMAPMLVFDLVVIFWGVVVELELEAPPLPPESGLEVCAVVSAVVWAASSVPVVDEVVVSSSSVDGSSAVMVSSGGCSQRLPIPPTSWQL